MSCFSVLPRFLKNTLEISTFIFFLYENHYLRTNTGNSQDWARVSHVGSGTQVLVAFEDMKKEEEEIGSETETQTKRLQYGMQVFF